MKVTFTLICLVLSLKAFTQKAFEYEYYYGKTKTFEIKLSLANGYIMGSKLIKTDFKTSKKTKYIASYSSNGNNLVFLPDTADGTIRRTKRNNIVLHQVKDDEESLPDKISGVYGVDLSTYRFTLYRQKN